MNINELFDPQSLPEDLQWLVSEWRLQPNDPVFALIAWHWHRVEQGEDRLRGATIELKTAVDRRIEHMVAAMETASAVQSQLEQIQITLAGKPLALGKQLERDLRKPVADTVTRIKALETNLQTISQTADSLLRRAQRRQALATFLIGTIVGGSLVLWLI